MPHIPRRLKTPINLAPLSSKMSPPAVEEQAVPDFHDELPLATEAPQFNKPDVERKPVNRKAKARPKTPGLDSISIKTFGMSSEETAKRITE